MDRALTSTNHGAGAKRWVAAGAGLMALAALGVGWMHWHAHAATTVHTVVAGARTAQIVGEARLTPVSMNEVSTQVAGTVAALPLQPGARVQADTVLLDLGNPALREAATSAQRQLDLETADDASLQADLAGQALQGQGEVLAAQHAAAVADVDLHAYEALQQRGAISGVELAKIRLQAQQAHAQLRFAQQRQAQLQLEVAAKRRASKTRLELAIQAAQQARQQVDALHVRAGAAGILSKLGVSPGQSLQAGQAVAEIMSPQVRADIAFSQADAEQVRVGMHVRLDAAQGQVEAVVRAILPRAADGNVHVLAELSRPPAWAQPDVECEASVTDAPQQRGLFVQAPAGARANAGFRVERIDAAGHRQAVDVQFGPRFGAELEVVSGLRAGDRIVAAPGDADTHAGNP